MPLGGLGPSLVGAAGSLLGGLFGKQKSVTPDEASRLGILGQAHGARQASEVHGFNPLTLLGVSSALPGSAGQNYMGAAIADASMMLADGLTKRQDAQKVSALEAENRKLKEEAQSTYLRPKVGGIYAQREAVRTTRQALGVPDENTSGLAGGLPSGVSDTVGGADSVADGAGAGVRPLPSTLPVDTRREVDNAPITSSGGFMVVDNPKVPFRFYFPTIDGDEPLSLLEYPSYAMGVVGSSGWATGQYAGRKQTDREAAKYKAEGGYAFKSGGKHFALGPYSDEYQARQAAKKSLSVRRKNPYYARQARVPGY